MGFNARAYSVVFAVQLVSSVAVLRRWRGRREARWLAAWTTRATAQGMQAGVDLHSRRVFPIVHSALLQFFGDATQAKSQYFPIRGCDLNHTPAKDLI
jgi:hypothetical protein